MVEEGVLPDYGFADWDFEVLEVVEVEELEDEEDLPQD